MSTDTTVSVLFRKSVICANNVNKNLMLTPNTERLNVQACCTNHLEIKLNLQTSRTNYESVAGKTTVKSNLTLTGLGQILSIYLIPPRNTSTLEQMSLPVTYININRILKKF